MRSVNYILADGTRTASYKKALTSGQRYRVELVDLKQLTCVSKKTAEILKTAGRVG